MQQFMMHVKGNKPLLMHNAQLANPFFEITRQMKEVTGKRKKTDSDHELLAELEFKGGLYHDKDLGPYIPDANVMGCLINGGKFLRLGEKVKQAVLIHETVLPLVYKGPRDVEGLWKDENFRHIAIVSVDRKRLTRTRPMFQQWEFSAPVSFNTELLSWNQIQQIVVNAGSYVGLGDWRPRFGTFEATLELQ